MPAVPAPPLPAPATVANGDVFTETLWNNGPDAIDQWMGNVPQAVVVQTIAQSIPNNAATAVTFDHAIRDNYSGLASPGANWYAPAAGVYLVQATANLAWTGATGKAVGAYLIVSGTTTWAAVEKPAAPTSTRIQISITALIPMATTDYVQMRLFHNAGAAQPTGSTDTACRMSARWVAL